MRFARTLTVFGLAFVLVAGLSPSAWAQISTGGIYGKVTDEQSAVLPGATVTLTGANTGARSTTSGPGGEFRFIGLDPGTYTVAVALPGFATTQRTVIVSAGVSVDVNFTAKVAGVAETVTVDAETPVIDTKKMGTGTTVSQQELTMIPNSRDPWAFMRAVPGVQVDRVNQAGSESGQQSGFIGKGSPATDAMWVLDGIVITDPAAVGASPTYFDFDAFDEVAITTGGADVRVATGGVGINLVTKRGSNAFHGGVSGFFAYDGLEASNLPADLEGDPRLQGSDKADHAEQLGEYGVELGGPIVKDRLWFWGSYGKQDLRIQRLTQARDKTVLEDYNAKLNFQVSSSNMLSAYWFLGDKIKLGRTNNRGLGTETASHGRDQGGVYEDGNYPNGFLKIEDNHVFSPSFMLNVKLSHYNTGFGLVPIGGLENDEGLDIVNSIAYGSSKQYQSVRPQDTINADASYFHGNHEFKFGYAYRSASTNSSSLVPGTGIEARTETARGKIARIQRELVSSFKGSYNALYLQDTFTSGRLTLQGGVRWDLQKAENAASTAHANPLFPEILPDLVYDGAGTKIEWSDISPRAGFTYALNDARKTLLRGNFSIFTQQLAHPDVTAVNPIGGVARVDYRWNDLNGDGFVSSREEVDIAGGQLGVPVNAELTTVNQIDENYRAPRDLELLVGIDHELAPNFAVGATYTYRRTTRTPYASYIGLNGSDWVPCEPVSSNGYTVPCQDIGPTNTAALDANSGGVLLSNRSDYHRSYSGIELTAVKRLSNKWMGRLGFGYNNWTESFDGTGGIQNPLPVLYDGYGYAAFGSTIVSDAKTSGGQIGYYSSGSGTVYWMPSKWQLSANALYQIGKGFEVAGNLYARQGYIRPINITVDNTFGDSLLAVGIGDERLPDVVNLDLRLGWNRNLGRARLNLTADVFNVFNSSTVLRRVDAADSGSFNRIDQILNPLLVRFGARLSF
ncbi:MAG TPA: TonB-dependent receptor [Vicinamibacteria bacterium]|nr:TonB-dependent receptor [Vicinamibacteria bacterium]